MTFSETMTTLANAVRDKIWYSPKLGIQEMASLLTTRHILHIPMPTVVNPNSIESTPKGDTQYFKIDGSINGWFYLKNWVNECIWITAGKPVTQSITIETDGNINSYHLMLYLAGGGDRSSANEEHLTKLADNLYRLTSRGIAGDNGNLEYFNFNLSISNATYVQFSEPYVSIAENKLGGGN